MSRDKTCFSLGRQPGDLIYRLNSIDDHDLCAPYHFIYIYVCVCVQTDIYIYIFLSVFYLQACRHSGILLVVSIYRQNSRRSRRQRRAGNTTGLTVAQSSASRVNVWHDIWVLHTLEQRKATLTPRTISFMGRFLANLGFPGILSPLPFGVILLSSRCRKRLSPCRRDRRNGVSSLVKVYTLQRSKREKIYTGFLGKKKPFGQLTVCYRKSPF